MSVFSDSSTNLGLVQDVLFRTNTDVNQFPLKDITRYLNEAYSRVANIIIQADGRMQWDDANHSDMPIATFDLVASQTSYEIFSSAPSALQDWLMIDRFEIKDANGNWYKLNQMDKRNTKIAMSEYMSEPSTPIEYDLNGTSIWFYPPTDYNSTNGGKIYFNRAPSYFASTDTTKRPGFATIFHPFLSIYAAHQWNKIKKGDNSLQGDVEEYIGTKDKPGGSIGKYYQKRNKSEVPKLRRAYQTYQ